MKRISKAIFSILLLSGCVGVQAQSVEENIFGKREELIQKYKSAKPFVVGFYNTNNKSLDMNQIWNRFLPFSNYLSEQLNKLVVLDIDKSFYNLNKELLNNMNVLYTTTLLSADLKKLDWKAVAIHNKLLNPVIIIPSADKAKEVKDLTDKKFALLNTPLSDLALYDLIKNGVFSSKEATQGKYLIIDGDVKYLLTKLENKQADAIIVNEFEAKKLLDGNTKYKIIKSNTSIYDMAVYVNPMLTEEEIQQVKNMFLGFNSENEKVNKLLTLIEEKSESENQFIEVNEKDLQNASEIFKLIKLKDVFRK